MMTERSISEAYRYSRRVLIVVDDPHPFVNQSHPEVGACPRWRLIYDDTAGNCHLLAREKVEVALAIDDSSLKFIVIA